MGIITKDVTTGTERKKAQKRNKEGSENNRKTRKVSEIRSSVRPDSIRTRQGCGVYRIFKYCTL